MNKFRTKLFNILKIFGASFAMIKVSMVSAQTAFAPGLCIDSVKNSSFNSVTYKVAYDWRYGKGATARAVPSSIQLDMISISLPILYNQSSNPVFTISTHNEYIPYGGEFPRSFIFDRFVVEEFNGRVLGVSTGGGNGQKQSLYSFNTEKRQFLPILIVPYEPVSGPGFRNIYTIARIPRLNLTLIGTDNGVFKLRGDTVEPLSGATGREVGAVLSITDLPIHGALMLAGYANAVLRRDDSTLVKLVDTMSSGSGRVDQVTGAGESKQPGRIITFGVSAEREIEMHPLPSGGYLPGRSSILATNPEHDGLSTSIITRSGEYLLLKHTSDSNVYTLSRMEANGLHAVPGDAISALNMQPWETPVITESKALGEILIGVKENWYAYDGNRVASFSGYKFSPQDYIGIPFNMATIGKTVMKTINGIFEFTADHRIKPLSLPFPTKAVESFSEIKQAGIGLIATKDNLYTLNQSGEVLPIRGASSYHYNFKPFIGWLRGQNGFLVATARGDLQLIVQRTNCFNAPTATP